MSNDNKLVMQAEKQAVLARLESAVNDLATVRRHAKEIEERYKEAREEFERQFAEQYGKLIEDREDANRQVAELEAMVREEALLAYEITGETKPVSGVSIVKSTKLVYPVDTAIVWAASQEKPSMFLSLKKRPAEKALRSLLTGGIGPNWLKTEVEMAVRIDRELGV